jgi:demethylmenaquinone methyltransferase/2-methoxy-6-polyprenyl-1,4-benzoquinol methylase
MSERPRLTSPEENAVSRDPDSVRQMFSRIADRYDLANHFLSAGCDFHWRKRAAEIVAGWNPPCVLDLATGSGDLALALQRRLTRAEITGADFSPEMLVLARAKGVRRTVKADALQLPFAAQSFDAVTVAFGLRNMRDWAAALREMRRVLTSSGHLLVLDFSLPRHRLLRAVYRVYLHKLVPRLCALLTRNKTAYEYLGASIENFPSGRAMCELVNANGFSGATAEPLTGGIVNIYTAVISSRVEKSRSGGST